MLQVVQNYKTGRLTTEDVPAPLVSAGAILLKTRASLISAGTERTKVETARMNLIEKAISRLDLVKTVVNNIKQEGLALTIKKAMNKLDSPISMGYSCSGEVIESGEGVSEFKPGQRVACVGEKYAAHAQINLVPVKFVTVIPDGVSYQEASFVGLGAIALNAVELAQVKENEVIAVIGLGLIGQLVIQILKSKGCRVLGAEIDDSKIELAKRLGLDAAANPKDDDIEAISREFSCGKGIDAVIITAASSNNLPIELAGKIARDKGRVILLGAMPITIPRKEYYEKELAFIISRGFGAGLYQKIETARLYPYDYRPISVKENMSNFLKLLADKKVQVLPLITHEFDLSQAKEAYELINTPKAKYLGIIFEYSGQPDLKRKVVLLEDKGANGLNVGFIGAGSFAQGYLLPALKKTKKVNFIGVTTASGINARSVAGKFGFNYCATDYQLILNDEKINCVFIATHHDTHAGLVIEALKKGKHIFVEKPLCIDEAQLKQVVDCYQSLKNKPLLMVGFNRRFSPFIVKAKDFFKNRVSPLVINYRINAGYLDPLHWVHESSGGGRVIGEVCHFIDVLQYLTGALPIEIFAVSPQNSDKIQKQDTVILTVKMSDGLVAAIEYVSSGDGSCSRERIEVFCENSLAVIDNFKTAVFTRSGLAQKFSQSNRDMGHDNEIKDFVSSVIAQKNELISFKDIIATTLATLKIGESLASQKPVAIEVEKWIKR